MGGGENGQENEVRGGHVVGRVGRETNVQPRRRLVERVRGGEDGLSRVCGLPLLLRPPRTHAMPPIGPSRPVAPTTTDGAARREEAFQERITIEGTFNPEGHSTRPLSPFAQVTLLTRTTPSSCHAGRALPVPRDSAATTPHSRRRVTAAHRPRVRASTDKAAVGLREVLRCSLVQRRHDEATVGRGCGR